MFRLRKALRGAAFGAAGLALSGLGASAAIVCTGNVCWHAAEEYEYPPAANVVVHTDEWRWGANEHFVWREHSGRGYWRGDSWIEW